MYLGSDEERKIHQQHAIKSMFAEADILIHERGETRTKLS